MKQWKPAALIVCLLAMGSNNILATPAHKGVATDAAWNVDTQTLGAALKERGFGEAALVERKKRHLEVHTRRNGVPVIVEFGPDGSYRAWKLPREQQPGVEIDADAAVAAAAAAGYGNGMVTRIKANHALLVATNGRGETVEVQVDGDGRITREKLLPVRQK